MEAGREEYEKINVGQMEVGGHLTKFRRSFLVVGF